MLSIQIGFKNKSLFLPRRLLSESAMKLGLLLIAVLAPASMVAQSAVTLPSVTVYSPRIANQSPAGTFAMPVSALRFEPAVDIHARNLAEGQADVTLRGGIFENTGFQVGAVTLTDPQTGHYFAEIPIAPAMLGAPEVVVGSDLALAATNATVGAIAHEWRPIRSAGAASVALGEHGFRRAEVYQGHVSAPNARGGRCAADAGWAGSESDGAIRFGDHRFWRATGRLQYVSDGAQTDLVGAYQEKFFGWPNLYTPFNSPESENLQTVLVALNHRRTFSAEEFFEFGVFHRRNKDDYAFNRFAPLGPRHPFQHTTWVTGAAASGRRALAPDLALNLRAEVLADELESTSLTFGRYRTRTTSRLALVPERTWTAAEGVRWVLKAGASLDDTNRGSSAVSPVFEVARERVGSPLQRVHFGFVTTTQVPTYTALNSSAAAGLFRGNPDLGRSRSHTAEIGVRGSAGGWIGTATAFARRDDALVDWTFRRGVTARTANAVDLDVFGFETVARRSWSAVDLVLGYTALTKNDDYRGATVDSSFYALNYARHRFTAAVTLRLGRGFELRLDNVARIQADNMLRVIGGDEAVTSALALAYRPPQWRNVEFTAQVDNAWDSDFQDVPAVPAAPRQFSFGVMRTW